MKLTRYIKLRTTCGDTVKLALQQNVNPLLTSVPVSNPSTQLTQKYLASFRVPIEGAAAGTMYGFPLRGFALSVDSVADSSRTRYPRDGLCGIRASHTSKHP